MLVRELRDARAAAGLTQEQLAELLLPTVDLPSEEARKLKSQTQRYISRCENGERRIDIWELRALCRAIGVSFVDLIQKVDAATS